MTVPSDETQGRPVEVTCPGCFYPRKQEAAAACPICKYWPRADRSAALLPVGTQLKGYVVGEKLGQGGFGITYRGFDVTLKMKVAIKEYYPSEFVGRSTNRKTVVLNAHEHEDLFHYGLKTFLQEAQTIAQLRHPHLVRVLNFFELNDTAYLVMDYYEGEDLARHLKPPRKEQPGVQLLWRRAVTLMLPVLGGLQKVHQAGFMHRDIKPGNLYLTRDDELILLDFGSARQVTGTHTRSLLIYSEGFAPYEQYLQGQLNRQGPWTDVYAVAATLYFMLTARRLPSALDRKQAELLQQPDALKPARHFIPDLPPALDTALLRALAVEPEQRLQSVAEFKRQLEGVLAEEEKREEEKGTGAKSKPLEGLKRPTKLNLRAAVIAGMVGMLAWGRWWIGFGRSLEPPHPESKPAAATSPVALTPPAVETPPTAEAPPVAASLSAVEAPPIAATPPAVEAPSVAPPSVVEPKMVQIPAGCFQMGSPETETGRGYDERQHEVCVKAYEIGAYEVTQRQWQVVMGSDPAHYKGDDYPVEQVSWHDVQTYLSNLNQKIGKNYRLPTEAEWEYACRGGVAGQTYCGGNDAGRVAWHSENSVFQTLPVGRKAANGFGLYDMSGNVWEWTCSGYDRGYGGAEAKYADKGTSNPLAVRGGSWNDKPARVRSADRDWLDPTFRDAFQGFRLTRSL